MKTHLQRIVQATVLTAEEIASRTREIYQRVLRESACLGAGNFTAIHPLDLRRMFDLYDQLFLQNTCRATLDGTLLHFSISRRMTRSAGKTTRRVLRDPRHPSSRWEYEISVAGTILFQTFRGEQRTITASGLICHDRLEALQRVMEHELVHLIEMLVWDDSSCSAPRFQSIAGRLFGHREHTHQLITSYERAVTEFGIRPGDRVCFRLDGRHYHGVVNRITKRATVLVEDPRGRLYSDGKRYHKFYVPLGMMEKSEG
jgi:hypothetical protein